MNNIPEGELYVRLFEDASHVNVRLKVNENWDKHVCFVDCGTEEENKAIAKLFSKAPQLLSALKEITKQYKNVRAAEGYPVQFPGSSIDVAEKIIFELDSSD